MAGVFTGQVALVTGGSRGIGRAIAERLAGSGALVVLTHADEAALAAEVVAGIAARGGAALAIDAFLGPAGTAEALAERFVAEVQARLGEARLDILVNNVGGGGYGRVQDTTNAFYDEVMDRNLRVPFFLVRALTPYLRPGGSVINIASAAVRLVLPELQAYSLAKAAQVKFTQLLAKELKPQGVRVNSVAPGFIDTDANRDFFADPANVKQVEEQTLYGRIGQPADIADVVHALASPDCRFVTAQLVEASGGFLL